MGVPFLPNLIFVSVWLSTLLTLSLNNKELLIIELETQLHTKQKEFAKGLRNKLPLAKLIEVNEEIKKIYLELSVLRSKM